MLKEKKKLDPLTQTPFLPILHPRYQPTSKKPTEHQQPALAGR